MARGSKTPGYEEQAAELHARRAKLAGQRREITDGMQLHVRVVDEAPARRHAALVAEARGDAPSEGIEQITLDAQRAAAEIVAIREKIAASEVVERELSAELTALVDRFPDYHVQKAEAASQTAQEAIAAASEAAQVAAQAWQAAYGAWGVVRTSRGRRNLDLSPGVPVGDLGAAVHELSTAITTPWPCGSREQWETWREREGITAPRPSAGDPVLP